MKRTIEFLLVGLCASTALGQTQVVVPNDLPNVEGNSSTSEPFTSTSFRFQEVFDASQFGIPAGTTVPDQ